MELYIRHPQVPEDKCKKEERNREGEREREAKSKKMLREKTRKISKELFL